MSEKDSGARNWALSAPRMAYRALATGIAVIIMEILAAFAALPLPLVPFVTSIVLTVSAPDAPASRPYPVIAGHMLSTLAGFIVLWSLGQGELQNGLAVALALLAMLLVKALHPPAALDAFVVTHQGVGSEWAIMPVLIGAVMLAVYGRATYWIERKLFGAQAV